MTLQSNCVELSKVLNLLKHLAEVPQWAETTLSSVEIWMFQKFIYEALDGALISRF